MDIVFERFSFVNQPALISLADILAALGISFLIGLFILFIYIKTFKGVMHSKSFTISILAMNLITTLVILAVAQHLMVALGMVGALSIVRFRTVIKEPLDLVFLFWSITIGIIVGTGLVTLALVGSVIVGIVMYLFINHEGTEIPYIAVISCSNQELEQKCLQLLADNCKKHVIKAKTVSKEGIELTVEVRLKSSSTDFINDISSIEGVNNATLVSYNGDYYI